MNKFFKILAAFLVTIWICGLCIVFLDPVRTIDTTLWPESASWLWQIKNEHSEKKGILLGTAHIGFGYGEIEKLKESLVPHVKDTKRVFFEIESDKISRINLNGTEKIIIEIVRENNDYEAVFFDNFETLELQMLLFSSLRWGGKFIKFPWSTLQRLESHPRFFQYLNNTLAIVWNISQIFTYRLFTWLGLDNGQYQSYLQQAQLVYSDLFKGYMKGKINALSCYKLMFYENEDSALFLFERNHAWMPRIQESLLAGEDPIIAVGAAHLFGRDGLINLLQEAGWVLEPIQINPFA